MADWALDGGIFGREAYRFDGSDPRFAGELMQGPLDPGSGAFGGDHWAEEYAAIRTANDLLAVIGTATALTAEEQSATKGFAQTIQAYNFLIVLDTHTQDSIPIDIGTDVTAPPAPFVTNAAAWTHVITLLDGAVRPSWTPAGTRSRSPCRRVSAGSTRRRRSPVQPGAPGPGGGLSGGLDRRARRPGRSRSSIAGPGADLQRACT